MKKKNEEKKNTGKIVLIVVLAAILLAAAALIAVKHSAPAEEPEESPAVEETVKPEASSKPEKKADSKDKDKSKDKSRDKAEAKKDKETAKPEPTVEAQKPAQNSGNNSTVPENNSSNSGAAKPEDTSAKEPEKHIHNWQPVYTTVKHEEKGHMETVTVTPAWDEEEMQWVTICNVCGYEGGDVPDHIILVHDNNGSYHSEQRPTGNIIHHEAVTEQKWIVDSPAYEEQVIDHYYCSCGETKKG